MKIYKKPLIFLILFFSIYFLSTQTSSERKDIISEYDIGYLQSLGEYYSEIYEIEKRKALKYAQENDIDVIIEKENGGIAILQKVLEDGSLIYFETLNAGSASTINTNQVYEGGISGLSLSGKNITLGIWDGGTIRMTHQELESRVEQYDAPSNLSFHATHVSGTMIASGIDISAKGMAYEAELSSYDFENDLPEMVNEAANGMLVSNHSYGTGPDSIEDEVFGAYVLMTAYLDDIAFNAPYYLPVFAAGNSNNAFPPYNPSKNGYDLISGYNLAKNIISVANVKEVNNYTDASSVEIWDSSSWGPTDDGRIKPDISAKGRLTYSCTAGADDAYSSYTGTSMAAPAISGSIALLQQHYNNVFGNYLTAASAKALVIHSAREAGLSPGPDYIYGWGLMDTAQAADLITNKNFTSILEENTLNDGDSYSFTVEAVNPNQPLVVTIVWTDPAGEEQDISVADDPTPRLVNDLDIKVTAPDGFTEFLPWKLDPAQPANPAFTGDNVVDNVEKIEIENAVGTYFIEVSHKGVLENLSQDYSLVVSGIAESDFAITTDEAYKSVCGNEQATFDIIVNSVDSFTDNVTLTQTGLPIELATSFGTNPIINQGQSTLTIDNLGAVPAGEYPFTVTASSGAMTYNFEFVIDIREVVSLNNVTLISPITINTDQWVWDYLTPVLDWNAVPDALFYEVQVSASPNFDVLTFSEVTENTQIESSELNADTTYHWRVRPLNDCVIGEFSSSYFNTPVSACYPLVFSTDTPIDIASSETDIVQSIIPVNTVLGGGNVIDVNVHLELSHTRLSDLIISLTSPTGTEIILFNQACGNLDDIDVIFDDKGNTLNCDANNTVALSGTIKPEEKLSLLENEQVLGDWILTVEDLIPNEGGSLLSFGLDICTEEILSINDTELPQFSIYPNPTQGIVEIDFIQNLPQDIEIEVINVLGKVLKRYNLNSSDNNFKIDLNELSSGIYFLRLKNKNISAVKKLIKK